MDGNSLYKKLQKVSGGPAMHDLQRLYRFLAEQSPVVSSRAVKAIRAGVKIIAQHPEIGRPANRWTSNSGNG